MKYRSSIKTSLEILRVLAENKQYAQYDLPKAISKDYRTVLRHLKTLEYNHLIRLQKTEPASKGGKDRKIYALTTEGLIMALMLEESWAKIDKIARKHANLLPLIFGKWEFFEKHGLKNLIIEFLRKTIQNESPKLAYRLLTFETLKVKREKGKTENQMILDFLTQIFGSKKVAERRLSEIRKAGEKISDAIEEMCRDDITRFVLWELPSSLESLEKYGSEFFPKFLSILKKDKELSSFISSEFERLEKQYEEYLKNIRSWKKMWQEIPSN